MITHTWHILCMVIPRFIIEDEEDMMRQEDVKEVISILMNSPFYLTLSVRERYGLVLRLIHDYPLLTGTGDTNLRGSADQQDRRTLVN